MLSATPVSAHECTPRCMGGGRGCSSRHPKQANVVSLHIPALSSPATPSWPPTICGMYESTSKQASPLSGVESSNSRVLQQIETIRLGRLTSCWSVASPTAMCASKRSSRARSTGIVRRWGARKTAAGTCTCLRAMVPRWARRGERSTCMTFADSSVAIEGGMHTIS